MEMVVDIGMEYSQLDFEVASVAQGNPLPFPVCFDNVELQTVPEPGALMLARSGLGLLGLIRRKVERHTLIPRLPIRMIR